MTLEPPSPIWLARSKREHNVPEHYKWVRCQGGCGQVVWYDPAWMEAAAQAKTKGMIVCSAACGILAAKKEALKDE